MNLRSLAACSLLAPSLATALDAQCSTAWQSMGAVRGLGASTFPASVQAAATWDPDGAGPLPLRYVFVGDSIQVAGSLVVDRIAAFEPVTQTWSTFGSGLNGGVFAVAALPNGDLVVGGDFSQAGGTAANRIARWNGTTWSQLGSSTPGMSVRSLAVMPNGDLIAGGFGQVARWNGTVWSRLGVVTNSTPNSAVTAVAIAPGGDLFIGGRFNAVGGVPASNVARFDGTSWSALGAGVANQVSALVVGPSGELLAGGWFTSAGGLPANHCARWDGTAWSAMGAGAGNAVEALSVLPTGDVLAGIQGSPGVRRWDGVTWSSVGVGFDDTVFDLVRLPNGELLASGKFGTADGLEARGAARWNGTAWSRLSDTPGVDGPVMVMTTLPNGDLVVGGGFTNAGGVPANGVARWNGSNWSGVGTGLPGTWVTALVLGPNGDLVSGGHGAQRLMRWDGAAWMPLVPGENPEVSGLFTLPNGDLIVAGAFLQIGGVPANRIARWNGSTWSPLGAGLNGFAKAMASLPNGDLVVAGTFGGPGGPFVARFDGTSWSPMDNGLFFVEAASLCATENGELFASDRQSSGMPGVYRWDGTTWLPFGSITGPVLGMAAIGSDLVVAGGFDSGGLRGLARWDGTTWSGFGPGRFSGGTAVHVGANGALYLSGSFVPAVGQTASSDLARIESSCAANATTFASGCASSGGANTLMATALPWIDGTLRTRAFGMPAHSWVVAVTGFAPLAPAPALSSLVPLGVPGCFLHVAGDILDIVETTNGAVAWQIFVPPVPAIVGVDFHHQMVPIEVDAQGNQISVTSTNALRLTGGSF